MQNHVADPSSSSPPSKLRSAETWSIAKPAFIAEPANRISRVVAFHLFPPVHAWDWSDIGAFVKKCSPTAHLTSKHKPAVHCGLSGHAQQVSTTVSCLGTNFILKLTICTLIRYPQIPRAVARTFRVVVEEAADLQQVH